MPVLGKGSYGCVYKPSMKCSMPNVDYTNKISKLMTERNAQNEINEYAKISAADRQTEFYPGVPLKCAADIDHAFNAKAFDECGVKKIDKTNALLIMNDGGVDLVNYATAVSKMKISAYNKQKIKLFWVESYRVLRGIKMLLDNGLVHHDLKPQNIVYNEKLRRINIIDYGLLKTVKDIMNECKNEIYGFDMFHFNFPPENVRYNGFSDFTFDDFNESMSIVNRFTKNFDKISIAAKYVAVCKIVEKTPDEIIAASLPTFDIYGAGISFMYVLQYSRHLLDPALFNEFEHLFSKMISFNVFERVKIDDAMTDYMSILVRHKLLKSMHGVPKTIVRIHNQTEKIAKKTNPLSEAEIERRANDDPVPRCFNGDKLVDNRCEKPCADGQERNPKTGRCVKIAAAKTRKDCPEGKTRNPKTGRCMKIAAAKTRKDCPEGKTRNPKTGRCMKIAAAKTRKDCPEGKTLNPKTGRCVKIAAVG